MIETRAATGPGVSNVTTLFDDETMAQRKRQLACQRKGAIMKWLASDDFPDNPPPQIEEMLEQMP